MTKFTKKENPNDIQCIEIYIFSYGIFLSRFFFFHLCARGNIVTMKEEPDKDCKCGKLGQAEKGSKWLLAMQPGSCPLIASAPAAECQNGKK